MDNKLDEFVGEHIHNCGHCEQTSPSVELWALLVSRGLYTPQPGAEPDRDSHELSKALGRLIKQEIEREETERPEKYVTALAAAKEAFRQKTGGMVPFERPEVLEANAQ